MTPGPSRKFPFLLFAILLTLDVVVALSQKAAGRHGAGQGWRFYWSMARTPWLWLALALPPAQLWTYTRILSRVDLSVAYPLTSLSVPLVMLAATLIFHEPLGWRIWAGGAVITVGVAMLGTDSHSTADATPMPTPVK